MGECERARVLTGRWWYPPASCPPSRGVWGLTAHCQREPAPGTWSHTWESATRTHHSLSAGTQQMQRQKKECQMLRPEVLRPPTFRQKFQTAILNMLTSGATHWSTSGLHGSFPVSKWVRSSFHWSNHGNSVSDVQDPNLNLIHLYQVVYMVLLKNMLSHIWDKVALYTDFIKTCVSH